ncbi:hypothetical protein Tco_1539413 [Tanacetum coccineum]
MNEDYYHEQNPCYDSNSFGFDQVQPSQYTVNHPIFNSQNELLNSGNKLMEQMTTLCDLVGQAIQKKEEEKRIAEEQAAKDRHLDTFSNRMDETLNLRASCSIPTKSKIKSSVEDLVPIPSESEGVPKMCDVPLCGKKYHPLMLSNGNSEIVVNSNDVNSSSGGDYCPRKVEGLMYAILLTSEDDFLRWGGGGDVGGKEGGGVEGGEKWGGTDPPINQLREKNRLKKGVKRKKGKVKGRTSQLILKKNKSGKKETMERWKRKRVERGKWGNRYEEKGWKRKFPPANRSDLYHEEFTDELAHIMSLPNL